MRLSVKQKACRETGLLFGVRGDGNHLTATSLDIRRADSASLVHHIRPAKPLLTQKLCFSPSRRVTFSLRVQRESNQRESTPDIRVWRLRRQTSLAPSPFQGPAYKGHPSPFTPLAASLPPIPFHVDSTRPPDGTRSQPERPCGEPKADFEKLVTTRRQAEYERCGRANAPVRRPSAGVA